MKANAPSAGLTTRQRITTVLSLALLVGSGVYLWTKLFPHTVADDANERMFICSETNKTFKHKLEAGETEPIKSPFTGRNTGVRAEACYWKKVGDTWKAKKKPTWVLVKAWMGQTGESTCPDCGHVVSVHNPMPPKELMDTAE